MYFGNVETLSLDRVILLPFHKLSVGFQSHLLKAYTSLIDDL